MQLIRPPPLPAPSDGVPLHPLPKLDKHYSQPYVYIKHPGYNDNSVLLELPAFDPLPSTGQGDTAGKWEVPVGVHHGTVLTICAIIADNAFDVYLSYDRDGVDRVDQHVHRDGILEAGEYWAQVPHRPSRPAEAGQQQSRGPVSITKGSAAEAAEAGQGEECITFTAGPWVYPIVRGFEAWDFPRGETPEPWLTSHDPPASLPRTPTSDSTAIAQVLDRRRGKMASCAISANHHALENAHIIPSNCNNWFKMNEMDDYGNIGDIGGQRGIDKPTNLITLRADLHKLFNSTILTIVPKPVSVAPSPPTLGSNPIAAPASQATQYALAVHVLHCKLDYQEVVSLFHNQALCPPENASPLNRGYAHSRQFFLARLAWSIFPLLRPFLANEPRLVITRVKASEVNTSALSMGSKPISYTREARWEQKEHSTSQTGSERSASQLSRDTSHAECNNIADDKSDGTLLLEGRALTTPVLQADRDLSQVRRWLMNVEAVAEGGHFT